jgi:hypothetical protein
MSNVLPLPTQPRHRRKVVVFERSELGQLLNLYSKRVAAGEWRDYAIDFRPGMAMFSIFRHTAEQPLYSVAKMAPGSQRQGDYVVINGPRKIAQGRSINEVLAALERQLRLIYSS